MTNVLDKIKLVPFSKKNYYDEDKPKSMIFLHHTASDPNPYGVKKYWETTNIHVSTPFIIGGYSKPGTEWEDGDIIQLYSSSKWAYHLGLTAKHLAVGGPKHSTNLIINSNSVAIEMCSWGGLTKTPRGFKSYAGTIVPDEQVITYDTPYRGYHYYQKYSPAQLENLKELVIFLCDKWNIPKEFKGMEMFDVDPRALCAEPGIWSHVSVRPPSDKQDCHPQPELIEVLKSL